VHGDIHARSLAQIAGPIVEFRGPSETTVAEPIETRAPEKFAAKSIQRRAASRSFAISSLTVKPLFEPIAKDTSVRPCFFRDAAKSL
jgi:hypothetical protein